VLGEDSDQVQRIPGAHTGGVTKKRSRLPGEYASMHADARGWNRLLFAVRRGLHVTPGDK
jgi:hypothetical protein